MRISKSQILLRVAAVLGVVALCTSPGDSQDPNLKPNYGSIRLKAGFEPDPHSVNVDAGGDIQSDKGGIKMWLTKEPDYQVVYEAGQFDLTFYVQSKADTCLLINLPNGQWVANDDTSENDLNPSIKIQKPASGRYEVWVGTFNKGGTPPAKLFVTELK